LFKSVNKICAHWITLRFDRNANLIIDAAVYQQTIAPVDEFLKAARRR